jgi:hypothetical protein
MESLWGKGSEWPALNVLISNPYLSEKPVNIGIFGSLIWGLHAIKPDEFHDFLICDVGG